jgi:hypothetical protein
VTRAERKIQVEDLVVTPIELMVVDEIRDGSDLGTRGREAIDISRPFDLSGCT